MTAREYARKLNGDYNEMDRNDMKEKGITEGKSEMAGEREGDGQAAAAGTGQGALQESDDGQMRERTQT